MYVGSGWWKLDINRQLQPHPDGFFPYSATALLTTLQSTKKAQLF